MRRLSLAAFAVLILLAAGCSSGGGASGAGSSAPASTSPVRPTPSSTSPVSDDEAAALPGLPSASGSPALPTPTTVPAVHQFIAAVFSDAQTDWQQVFAQAGQNYTPARLVQFSSAVHTGCGTESSDVGPFYCPADHTVYLDVLFFEEMERNYGVTGDFAMAYVVAHEIGHHIQTITGLSAQVAAAQQAEPAQANTLSIQTELQADCYAGVWAHSTYERDLLEPGDLDEALTAAAAVGDDFIQHSATGSIQPEQWTHGSSAQRQHWLTTGFDSGKPSSCNTFAAPAG